MCYSFWVLSAMSILNKIPWINADKLTAFILSAQVRSGSCLVSLEDALMHRVLSVRIRITVGLRTDRGTNLTYSIHCLALQVCVFEVLLAVLPTPLLRTIATWLSGAR